MRSVFYVSQEWEGPIDRRRGVGGVLDHKEDLCLITVP